MADADSTVKLCECGCGRPAPITKPGKTHRAKGYIAGQPVRFIMGHGSKAMRRETGAYVRVYDATHPRSASTGQVLEHLLIAERALGKPLPKGAEVHHVNGNGRDNRGMNLVICQDHAYHMLLHARQRVRNFGGDPNTQRICNRCNKLEPIDQFYLITPRSGPSAGKSHLGSTCKKCYHFISSETWKRRKASALSSSVGMGKNRPN